MSKLLVAILSTTVFFGASSVVMAESELPDGKYTCLGLLGRNLITLGYVEIRGTTYRGPSHDLSGPFNPFSILADGFINWSHGFGEFGQNGSQLLRSQIAEGTSPHFLVNYLSPAGNPNSLDCVLE